MPRQPRKKAESGIYHVMIRGIDKAPLFREPEDYERFIRYMCLCLDDGQYKMYAYCLMNNHVHFLIRENDEPISKFFQRLEGKYVYWFNAKYQRVGHLYQDRFRAEPVEDDSYFLTVLRYIHRNPVKAGLVSDPADYKYSSYSGYFSSSCICDTEFVSKLLPPAQFERFHLETAEEHCLDVEEPKPHFTDEQAQRILFQLCGTQEVEEFQNLNSKSKSATIRKMKDEGLSIRQIARLTGESYYYVQQL